MIRELFGVAIGDRVWLGKEPELIHEVTGILGPLWVEQALGGCLTVMAFPHMSLTCETTYLTGRLGTSYFNGIHREGEKLLDWHRNELKVTPWKRKAWQGDLFSPAAPPITPYPWEPGVDYDSWDLWRCRRCEKDFNAPKACPTGRTGRYILGAPCPNSCPDFEAPPLEKMNVGDSWNWAQGLKRKA